MSATSKSAAEDVGAFFTAAGYTGLYTNFQPDLPDAVIVVNDSGGRPSDKAMGRKNVAFELPRVQVVVRDSNADTAYTRAYALYVLLDGERAQTINDNTYDYFECMQMPFLHGRDPNGRTRYAFNVDIMRKPVS